MGNKMSINKITFEDVRYAIEEKYILINTLLNSEQELLIKNTITIKDETELLNKLLTNKKTNTYIIIYGKNSHDNTIFIKYDQLIALGFTNVYIYIGGIFEWLLLQDIYGDMLFPTNIKILDILKFKPNRQLNIKLLTN
jgi:rhodanese-related sulfurtransferase